MASASTPEFLPFPKVAKQLGVSVRTLCNLRDADPPLAIDKVGNRSGVGSDNLLEYIRRSRLPAYQPLTRAAWLVPARR
jgi:hypothetical protein